MPWIKKSAGRNVGISEPSSLAHIVWETEIWVADTPTHLIYFDGMRSLRPSATEQAEEIPRSGAHYRKIAESHRTGLKIPSTVPVISPSDIRSGSDDFSFSVFMTSSCFSYPLRNPASNVAKKPSPAGSLDITDLKTVAAWIVSINLLIYTQIFVAIRTMVSITNM
jgi:hypothetical protein